jgi:hypothetical protein
MGVQRHYRLIRHPTGPRDRWRGCSAGEFGVGWDGFDVGSPYGAPEHRKALGKRPEGVAHKDMRDRPTR